METVLKYIQRVDRADVQAEQKQQNLLDEIKEVGRMLSCNEVWFQMECDENLIDSCIYQREALQARYRYLLAAAKRQGVSAISFQNK